jgi:hypothetical protein
MVRGHVVEIMKDRKIRDRGDHDFVQLPSPGDRLMLGNDRGDIETVRVLRIKHVPVRVPAGKFGGSSPFARIYVEWVEKWNDDE